MQNGKSKAFYNVLLAGNKDFRRRADQLLRQQYCLHRLRAVTDFRRGEQLPGFGHSSICRITLKRWMPRLTHDPQRFTFAMTHIPLLVWLSDAFMVDEPDRVKSAPQPRELSWTNDLLYDLLIGLTGIDVETHDPSYDLLQAATAWIGIRHAPFMARKRSATIRSSCPPRQWARPARLPIRFASRTLQPRRYVNSEPHSRHWYLSRRLGFLTFSAAIIFTAPSTPDRRRGRRQRG